MSRYISLIDDLDGISGATTRTFAVGGIEYEIDLHDDNYKDFLMALERWRSVARVRRSGEYKLTTEDRAKIRAWAQRNGYEIKERGRFPHAVIQAYFDAVSSDPDA
jgi:hypothetical protein